MLMNIIMLLISRCDTLKPIGTYIVKKFDHGSVTMEKKSYDMGQLCGP